MIVEYIRFSDFSPTPKVRSKYIFTSRVLFSLNPWKDYVSLIILSSVLFKEFITTEKEQTRGEQVVTNYGGYERQGEKSFIPFMLVSFRNSLLGKGHVFLYLDVDKRISWSHGAFRFGTREFTEKQVTSSNRNILVNFLVLSEFFLSTFFFCLTMTGSYDMWSICIFPHKELVSRSRFILYNKWSFWSQVWVEVSGLVY